jgi:hypothetical protein
MVTKGTHFANALATIIEFTTCFHEFSEYESTIFFYQYFSVENENKFFIGQKMHTFSLTCERLRKLKQILHNVWWKKFVD